MSNNLTEEDLTLERMCLVNHVGSGGSTVVMRKSVLSFVGGFDVSIQYGEDWDLWLRMMRTHNCAFVAEPLAYIRRHTSAQHLGITQERLEQALSEHLHLLDKAFDSWPGVLPDDLRERSFAYRYAVFAIRGYLAGHLEWGRAKLAQAIQLYPEHWTEAERFSTLFFNELFLRVQTGQIDVRRAEKCILAVFARLPQFLDLPSDHKSEKLAEFYATVLFGSSKARDWARVRYCLPRLIWHDPSWLQNRGIWSIATEAFLGKGIADGLRRLV
jgi:hypothetical protein